MLFAVSVNCGMTRRTFSGIPKAVRKSSKKPPEKPPRAPKSPKSPIRRPVKAKEKIVKSNIGKQKVNKANRFTLHKLMPGHEAIDKLKLLTRFTERGHLETGRIDDDGDIFKLHEPSKDREEKLFQQKARSALLDIYDIGTGFGPTMPQSHFTWLIVARRFSGKSTLINSLIKKHLVSMRVKDDKLVKSQLQFFKKKILCSPTAGKDKSLDSSEFDHIYKTKEQMEELIATIKNAGSANGMLIVLDDVQTWIDAQSNSLLSWFATVNRHYGCSLIISVQNLKQGISPSIRNNCSEFTTFKIANAGERLKIQQEIGANYIQMYDMVNWDTEYQYLHMKITKGPTMWFFQGIGDESKKPRGIMKPNYSLSWKFLGKE